MKRVRVRIRPGIHKEAKLVAMIPGGSALSQFQRELLYREDAQDVTLSDRYLVQYDCSGLCALHCRGVLTFV